MDQSVPQACGLCRLAPAGSCSTHLTSFFVKDRAWPAEEGQRRVVSCPGGLSHSPSLSSDFTGNIHSQLLHS